MSDLLEIVLTQMVEKYKTDIEISFVARVISFDKSKMTCEISPLLETKTPGAKKTLSNVQNIKDVRIERSPGIRPIYAANDLVRVVCAASPLEEPIENGRPSNTLGHKFSISFCTITGRVNPKTFTPPSQYSNDGLILSDDPNFYINFKTDQVYIKGKTVIDGPMELNGNARSFVTHAELNSALQGFVTSYGTHTHTETGAVTTPPIVPVTLDISAAKTDNVKTGAG